MIKKFAGAFLTICIAFGAGCFYRICGEAGAEKRDFQQCYEENTRLLAEVAAIQKEIESNSGLDDELESLYEQVQISRDELKKQEETVDSALEYIKKLEGWLQVRDIKSDMTKEEMSVRINAVLYKLFYGKWRISSVIQGRNYKEEHVDAYLGKVVEYAEDSIKVDEKEVLTAPVYAYGVFPIEIYGVFVQGYSPEETYLKSQNDYFIYVSVETVSREFTREDYAFKNFFIIDDDTLVLDAYDVFFVMERLAYAENYDELVAGRAENW